MKKFELPMNLQYFADPEPNTEPTETTTEPNATEPDDKAGANDDSKPNIPAGYHSDDEVNEIVNQKFAKWKKQEEQKIEEAKKLEKMNADEKTQYELEQMKAENEQLKSFKAKQDMVKQARQMATDAEIEVNDTDLSHVVTTEADSTKENLDWLADFAKRIKENAKAEFLKGTAPTVGGKGINQNEDNYGARLASLNQPTKKNPYFKN